MLLGAGLGREREGVTQLPRRGGAVRSLSDLPPAVRRGLAAAGRAAAEYAQAPWWIIGSAAAALHGVRVGPIADIDVLCDRADAERLLRAAGTREDVAADRTRFRSHYGRWQAGPITIEVMGGLEVREAGGWWTVTPATRQRVVLEGVALFVPERAELAAIMSRFGRPKDHLRVALLDPSRP